LRSTNLGTLLLSISIVFAFVSVLFSNISFAILSVAFAASYVYAYLKFIYELERTDLKIERKILDEMAFAGQPMAVTTDVLNKDPMAVRGTFEDMLPGDCILADGINKTTMTLPAKSVLRMSYTMIPQKRGAHKIPGVRIDRTDAYGLFTEEQLIEQGSEINVHTEKGSFDAARKMAGREHLEFSGMGRNPAIVLREFEFDGIREYVPGDRARDIHWKLLPKLGKLMTKTYRKEGAVHTTIFVDCGRSMRLKTAKIAKIDHALNLSMQLSRVLLSSFHPAGVAAFDEMSVMMKVSPSLGRHQFDKIVKALREVPGAIEYSGPPSTTKPQTTIKMPKSGGVKQTDDGKKMLSALDKLSPKGGRRRLGIGLEGGIKDILARNRGQEQLFIVISDLISSRNAVLAGAAICQSTGNRILVIHTYDDWFRNPSESLDLPEMERLYDDLGDSVKTEAAIRGLGGSYIRIGPADTAPRIVRAIRRGKT
jgi:uncharacterized protein (DUF58 family)